MHRGQKTAMMIKKPKYSVLCTQKNALEIDVFDFLYGLEYLSLVILHKPRSFYVSDEKFHSETTLLI